MSRYRGPRLKITRRLGDLPGLVQKRSASQNPPGEHGASGGKLSQYALRLQEKQKIRYHYGVTERQLWRYVQKARSSKGSTGELLIQLLENRLDATIFRIGLAPTIRAARQYINHGHVSIDGKKVSIPSVQCTPNQNLTLSLESAVTRPVQPFQRTNLPFELNELLIVEFYSRK
jgi:small subunit ribosomal protein S4